MSDISSIKNTSNVSKVSTGGGGSSASYSQGDGSQNKDKKPSKLRLGEIVRATVVERIDDEMAYVRIPTGTFKAIVGKNLKNNDSLLFKVSETSPYLILKIHEVPTGNKNNTYPTDELLRILDLPENDFNTKLVEIFKNKKTSILRDDVLNINKVYNQYAELNKYDNDLTQFLNLVVELNMSKLPLSINLINKLFPLYVEENVISEALNYLERNVKELPNDLKDKVESILEDVKSNKYSKNNMFVLAISEEKENQTFFEILNEIDERNDVSKSYKGKSNIIRDLIGSLSLWNIISFSGKTPLQYFIPYYYEGYYFIIRIVKRNYTNAKLEPLSFYFSVPTENLGDVKNKMLAFQKQLKLYMSNDNNKFIESLDTFKEKLIASLEKRNYSLDSLKISVEDISKELNQINSSDNNSRFTVVV